MDMDSYPNPIVWWESIKYKVKHLTIEISKSINISKNKFMHIEKRLNDIKDSNDKNLIRESDFLKQQIKEYYENQLQAVKIRSRIKCFEEGEKSSKFFFNTEKKNASNKIWTKIKCNDGSYNSNINVILNEQKRFFEKLFTSEGSNEREARALLANVDKHLNDEEKTYCDADLTEGEIFDTIKLLKPNKSPGDDGIVSEFYKEYWYLIREQFTKVVRYIFNINTLSPSQYNAILTLLYKKGEREDIKNWRPISLLNADYKILTKILAERLKKVLPKIIHPDQKGFVQGRNINQANRLLQDIIHYSDQKEQNAAIIFLDYEKAFDRVEWSWTLQCLKQFNFGNKFISWIDMVFKNAKTSILTNGFRSSYFKISRSMRQGCPVSPLLFILQAEPLACALRKNTNIKGIPLPIANPEIHEASEAKINAYVDDSQFFVSNEDSIVECFNVLNSFEKSSGAKVNKAKTYGLYIGPWKNKSPEFKDIQWTKDNVKTLGIHHGYNIDENTIWLEKINKMKNCIKVWKSRDLTFIGKVLVIKTLLLSQIGFLTESLIIAEKFVKEIESLLWSFLWNSKQPVVSRNTMHLSKEFGGVNMPNLRNILMSKQIKVIYNILESKYAHWNMIGKNWLRKFDIQYNDSFFLCKASNIKGLDISDLPIFYQRAINSWISFKSRIKITDKTSIINSNLFGNNSICVRNTPLFYDNFCKSNIKTVNDVWNKNTQTFYDEIYIKNRLEDKTNWRQRYIKIKNNIPDSWVNILKETCTLEPSPVYISINQNLQILLNGKYVEPEKLKIRILHNFLLDDTYIPKCQTKWNTLFNKEFDWKRLWHTSLEIPCSNKEKQFHWKILHNAIFTEHRLQLMNLSNGVCHFCRSETEDVKHLFALCSVSKEITRRLKNKMNNIINTHFDCSILLQSHDIITGYLNKNKIIRIFVNFVLHVFKWEIWKIRNLRKHENKLFTQDQVFVTIAQKIANAARFIELTNAEPKFRKIICMLKQFE